MHYDSARYEEAMTDLNLALDIDSSYVHARFLRGNTAFMLKDYPLCVSDLTRVASVYGNTSYLYLTLGTAHMNMRQWEDSDAAYTKGIAVHPDYCHLYERRGLVRLQMGKDEGCDDLLLAENKGCDVGYRTSLCN